MAKSSGTNKETLPEFQKFLLRFEGQARLLAFDQKETKKDKPESQQVCKRRSAGNKKSRGFSLPFLISLVPALQHRALCPELSVYPA